MFKEDNAVYHLTEIIKSIRETDRIDRKLSDTLILIDALDDETRKKLKTVPLKTYLNKFMRNSQFRRAVDIRNKMMLDTEEALAYLGTDYMTDPDHAYDEDLEEQIREIEEKIRSFLSQVYKELLNEDFKL